MVGDFGVVKSAMIITIVSLDMGNSMRLQLHISRTLAYNSQCLNLQCLISGYGAGYFYYKMAAKREASSG